jgi:hypothetical protein
MYMHVSTSYFPDTVTVPLATSGVAWWLQLCALRPNEYADLNPCELNMFKTSIVFVENRRCVFNTYLYYYCEMANLYTLRIRSSVPVRLFLYVQCVVWNSVQFNDVVVCGNT